MYMNTPVTHKSSLIIIAVFVVLLFALGYITLSNYTISISPKPQNQACSDEVLRCPNGSTAHRVPPNCEFTRCATEIIPSPGGQEGGNDGTVTVSIMPGERGDSALSKIPDLPIEPLQEPSPPLSVKYVVEHRSALSNKKVMITGVVVENNLNANECADGQMCAMLYIQPNIVIAATDSPTRDKTYDIRISMSEEDRNQMNEYAVGKTVQVLANVSADKNSILLIK